MPLTLSLNTNPLVNRFADPDDLIDTVARDLKIRDLQLTHEFINPSWPAPVIRRLTRQMNAALDRTGVRVTSGMTGPYGRLNHFGHPDRDVRRYYVDWFKTFADITVDLGGTSVGTQFAIFTFSKLRLGKKIVQWLKHTNFESAVLATKSTDGNDWTSGLFRNFC